MLDIFGRPIRVGDVLVSPARKGARQWLRCLRVTSVDAEHSRITGYLPHGRHATIWGESTRQLAIIKGAQRRELTAATN